MAGDPGVDSRHEDLPAPALVATQALEEAGDREGRGAQDVHAEVPSDERLLVPAEGTSEGIAGVEVEPLQDPLTVAFRELSQESAALVPATADEARSRCEQACVEARARLSTLGEEVLAQVRAAEEQLAQRRVALDGQRSTLEASLVDWSSCSLSPTCRAALADAGAAESPLATAQHSERAQSTAASRLRSASLGLDSALTKLQLRLDQVRSTSFKLEAVLATTQLCLDQARAEQRGSQAEARVEDHKLRLETTVVGAGGHGKEAPKSLEPEAKATAPEAPARLLGVRQCRVMPLAGGELAPVRPGAPSKLAFDAAGEAIVESHLSKELQAVGHLITYLNSNVDYHDEDPPSEINSELWFPLPGMPQTVDG